MTIVCGICDNTILLRKQATVSCAGLCKKQFHAVCIHPGSDEFVVLLSKINGLTWKCNACIKNCLIINETKLNEVIENKVAAALATITSEITYLREEFAQNFISNKSVATSNQSPIKYSQVLQNKTEPVVIIRPKNSEQSNVKTKLDINESINPADSNLQLSKVKHIRDGGILIGCKNNADNDKLRKLAQEKLSDQYTVKEVRGIKPRVRIAGISQKLSDQELVDILVKQNGQLINCQSECTVIKCYPTKKNQNIYQAILQLNKKTYEKVMKAGNLFIGFDSCPVFDGTSVYRCFNCNGFNHSSKSCKKACTCPRCGECHSLKDCKSNTVKCINCHTLKRNSNLSDIDVNHAAWDSSSCTAYIQACDKLRSDMLSIQ